MNPAYKAVEAVVLARHGKREEHKGWSWRDTAYLFIVGLACIAILAVILTVTASLAWGSEIRLPDFVGPTLNKTIVTTRHGTHTIPAPPGSGTRYITKHDLRCDKRPVQGYTHVPSMGVAPRR